MSVKGCVLVVGGGIGGLTAAIYLARAGIAVEVVEAREPGTRSGVGLNQPANALRVMQELGLLDECLASGFQYDRTRFFDLDGRLVVEIPSRLGGEGLPANNGLSRATLHRILSDAASKAGAQIRTGISANRVDEDGDGVHVSFSDSPPRHYEVVVAFDGVHSTIRRHLFGDRHDPQASAVSVWRVTLGREPSVTTSCVYQGRSNKAGVIPISNDEMYLYLVSREPVGALFPPESLVAMLEERLDGYGGLIGSLRDAGLPAGAVICSPLQEVLLPLPWSRGRVAVAGDAAHASAPHLTQGAAMAMEDAAVLGATLAGNAAQKPSDVVSRLEAWALRRYPRCHLVQDVSHRLMTDELVRDDELDLRLRRMPEELTAQLWEAQERLNQCA